MRRSTRPFRAAALVPFLTVSLAGCFTGQRPTLTEPVDVGDPAVQAVLDRLSVADSAEFAAVYEIIPTLTGEPTRAEVTNSGGRLHIRIGTVDYLIDGTVTRTCENGERGCVDELDDARISDLNVTHRFWGAAFRTRLELDAGRRIDFSTPSDDMIAGQPAACVDIPVPSASDLAGLIRYCALDAGPLARYIGADVSIELVEFSPTP
jgi:hypothetical protein